MTTKATIWADGGSYNNQLASRQGYCSIALDVNGKPRSMTILQKALTIITRKLGEGITNNAAELEACLMAFQYIEAVELRAPESHIDWEIYSDSTLVVNLDKRAMPKKPAPQLQELYRQLLAELLERPGIHIIKVTGDEMKARLGH